MGIGAEIAAQVAESEVFDVLDAPIARLGGADAPIPYNPALEKAAVPQEDDIVAAARRLVRHGESADAAIEVVLPKVDMDMESGVIAAWQVAEGDIVNEGDILFEMETNKAMMEVEAPGTRRDPRSGARHRRADPGRRDGRVDTPGFRLTMQRKRAA